MRSVALARLTLGIAFGATPALAGPPPGLGGTWEGSTSCKLEDASGKGSSKNGASVVSIIQVGASGPLVVDIDGAGYSGTFVRS